VTRDVFATTDTRCQRRDNGALVLTLEQPRPSITSDVLDAFERAVDMAEHDAAALVIASAGETFAFGADLGDALAAAMAGRPDVLDRALDRYQRVMLRLRHAKVPTVAAVRGVAVSGGCEVLMHCTRVVAHAGSRIGLFEPSVGVVPGGGGLKEFARRAADAQDSGLAVARAFKRVAASTIAAAADAQRFGFLTELDHVDAMNPLEEAVELGLALHAAGHTPPPPNPTFTVVGRHTEERLCESQRALHRDGKIGAHQLEINTRIANVLCGGDAPGATRTEADLLALERKHFLVLAQMKQTQDRLLHMRDTGRPLAN
jgi:3-hydroxyacyl-CoA dehydrogenase